jgi:hypothetical protein
MVEDPVLEEPIQEPPKKVEEGIQKTIEMFMKKT